jgi:hypothetical protein
VDINGVILCKVRNEWKRRITKERSERPPNRAMGFEQATQETTGVSIFRKENIPFNHNEHCTAFLAIFGSPAECAIRLCRCGFIPPAEQVKTLVKRNPDMHLDMVHLRWKPRKRIEGAISLRSGARTEDFQVRHR